MVFGFILISILMLCVIKKHPAIAVDDVSKKLQKILALTNSTTN